MEQDNKQAYLKCKISGDYLSSPIIEFESIYFGYHFGDCVVNNDQLKQMKDNSWLVKLVGGTSKNDGKITPNNEKYVYIKINSIFDKGIAHFLVPEKDVVYIEK